jgi:glyoxalase family protein
MTHPLLGLHHVTATVDDAQPDLDFCLETLGLRLLKKTVNFDNHHVYHFYYGTERGAPGTIWTTFPYHGRGVRIGQKGAGQVVMTSFSVPEGSLEFWKTRLASRGIAVQDAPARFGDTSIVATDPSGLVIELIANATDAREPYAAGGIEPTAAIRGIHSVSMVVRSLPRSVDFLVKVLGFQKVDEMDQRARLSINGSTPGHMIDLVHAPDAPPALNGLGTVHHVAFAIATADEQRHLRKELLRLGYSVTEVLDRQYFQSIYFREPGGVLFEVATVPPGFTVDEPLAMLGQSLKLPPWEEPNRADIETGLATVKYRA